MSADVVSLIISRVILLRKMDYDRLPEIRHPESQKNGEAT